MNWRVLLQSATFTKNFTRRLLVITIWCKLFLVNNGYLWELSSRYKLNLLRPIFLHLRLHLLFSILVFRVIKESQWMLCWSILMMSLVLNIDSEYTLSWMIYRPRFWLYEISVVFFSYLCIVCFHLLLFAFFAQCCHFIHTVEEKIY